MDNLIIKGSQTTPLIRFLTNGKMTIMGRCIMENPDELFKKLVDWVNDYREAPAEETILTCRLEYINSASVKHFLHFLKALKKSLYASKLKVQWVYEEDDEIMREAGESLQSLADIPFEFLAKPSVSDGE